jgi:hypothetical protein
MLFRLLCNNANASLQCETQNFIHNRHGDKLNAKYLSNDAILINDLRKDASIQVKEEKKTQHVSQYACDSFCTKEEKNCYGWSFLILHAR